MNGAAILTMAKAKLRRKIMTKLLKQKVEPIQGVVITTKFYMDPNGNSTYSASCYRGPDCTWRVRQQKICDLSNDDNHWAVVLKLIKKHVPEWRVAAYSMGERGLTVVCNSWYGEDFTR